MRAAENWSWCTVGEIRDLTPRVREITLVPDHGAKSFAPGSHIDVKVLVDGRVETRSYSLVEGNAEAYRVAVHLAPDGHGGSRYLWSLKPGARLEASTPSNHFEIDWTRETYSIVAGGIGITPLVGIAEALARRGAEFTLHYCATSRAEAAYLEELQTRHGDRIVAHISAEDGRIDLDAVFAALPSNAMVALCGPMRLLDAARRSWAAGGRPPLDLAYETFGSSGLLSTEPFRVRISNSDTELLVPVDRSMLSVLNEAGHEVVSDCESGECGVCVIGVLEVEGEIDHRDVFFSARERNGNRKICPCVSRAHGLVTVDTLYRPDQI